MYSQTLKRSFPVLFAAAIAGCTPKPATVNVAPASVRLNEAGKTASLSAAVLDKNGTAIEKAEVTWSSSNPAVATVAAGNVTAVKSGKTVITAAAGIVAGNAEVIVSIPASIETSTASLTLQAAVAEPAPEGAPPAPPATASLTATVKDDAGSVVEGAALTFTSANPEVATVDASGQVSAVAAGETAINVTSGSLSASVQVIVTVPPPPPPPVKGKKR